MDRVGQHGGKAISRRIGPTGAIANVAYCGNMLNPGRGARRHWDTNGSAVKEHGLTPFARESSGAALGDEIRGAGMEVHAKTGNGALARGAYNAGATWRGDAAVGSAVRVNPESLVFFNDPAIVGERRQSTDAGAIQIAVFIQLGIQHLDLQIAGGWEGDGRGSGGSPALRVLHRVIEGERGRQGGSGRSWRRV